MPLGSTEILSNQSLTLSCVCTASGLQDGIRSGFAGYHCSLHKSLPLRKMFTRKKDIPVGFLQRRSNRKPLTRPIKGVSPAGEGILLPGLLLDRQNDAANFLRRPMKPAGVDDVLYNPILQLGLRRRSNIVRLVADSVAAQNSLAALLSVSTVKTEVRRQTGADRKSTLFGLGPEALCAEDRRLCDSRVLQFFGCGSFLRRNNGIPDDAPQAMRGHGADTSIRRQGFLALSAHGYATIFLKNMRYFPIPMDVVAADGVRQRIHQPAVPADNLEIHFIRIVNLLVFAAQVFRGSRIGGIHADGFSEIGAIHQIPLEKVVPIEAQLLKLRPPVQLVHTLQVR